MIYRVLDVLVRAAEARVPQITAVILGGVGAGTGLLFLLRGERFSAAPSLAAVIDFAPAVVWGLLFLVCGVCLINTAILRPRKMFWFCLALGRLMGLFTVLSGLGLFGGTSIGLLSLYTLALGALCDLNGVAALAPWLRRGLDKYDAETVGA